MTRMNWDRAGKVHKPSGSVAVKEIKVDADFWRCWKSDSLAMKAAGYRLQKTKDGWRAFIEIRG